MSRILQNSEQIYFSVVHLLHYTSSYSHKTLNCHLMRWNLHTLMTSLSKKFFYFWRRNERRLSVHTFHSHNTAHKFLASSLSFVRVKLYLQIQRSVPPWNLAMLDLETCWSTNILHSITSIWKWYRRLRKFS